MLEALVQNSLNFIAFVINTFLPLIFKVLLLLKHWPLLGVLADWQLC